DKYFRPTKAYDPKFDRYYTIGPSRPEGYFKEI
ncbi:unnamed protein product, partial [marine sediment metagenome]